MKYLMIILALCGAAWSQQVFPPAGGGGGGGGTPGTPVGSVQVNVASAFSGDAGFVANFSALAQPSAPTLVKVGTGTGTTRGYVLVCGFIGGAPLAFGSVPSAEATISGNATLDMTHSVTVTIPTLTGVATSCDVYRTTAGGTPNTTGLIGNAASGMTLSDTGLPVLGVFTFAPSVDYSIGVGSNVAYVNTSMGSCFGTECIANNIDFYPFYDTDFGLAVLSGTSRAPAGAIASFMSLMVADSSNRNATATNNEVQVAVNTSRQMNAQENQVNLLQDAGLSLSGRLMDTANYISFFGSTLANADGINNYNELDSGTVTGTGRLINNYNSIFTGFGSLIPLVYANYTGTPQIGNGGSTITTFISDYTAAIGGTATNAYSFWSDEDGVFRIKSDNTFDSVYQAIPALYNPQFTKYTPGATNYERMVLSQWDGNVAEVGPQAGGTGTLRNLKLLGASLLVDGLKTTGAATGKTVVCVDVATGQLYASTSGVACAN